MLDELVAGLQASRGLAHKRDIEPALRALGVDARSPIAVGDDCAAIADGAGGFLLFAIEGFIPAFVERDPWFAGWCGIMVNLSDIYAMGGRPLAVVDAIWSRGTQTMREVLDGMAAAARTYCVPVVGGHSNAHCESESLAVAVLGRAQKLLSGFAARPDDCLLAVFDLRGAYREPFPHWNCSTAAPPERLRSDLDLLPQLAEDGLAAAAKDVSQAGVIGTALMLLESSGIGAEIDVNAIPRPPGAEPLRWLLSTFPSYGFVLAVPPPMAQAVVRRFAGRDLACAVIGRCDASRRLRLRAGSEVRTAWDFHASPLIGCGDRDRGAGLAAPPAAAPPPLLEQDHA
jgi:AIR synthase-related protein